MARIVIADDSETMRRIVSGVLTAAGHEVIVATDGVEAVQAVFRSQPDAVVLDVQMPRLYGYVAARLLKDDWATADIPVVLLTSLDAASDRFWGEQNGADRYLTKDFEAHDLARTVAEVLDAAALRRGARPRLSAGPVELSDAEVWERTCDVLDRTLFASSVAAEVIALAASAGGFEETLAGLLAVVHRVVDCGLAGLLLVSEREVYLGVGQPISAGHLPEFLARTAAAAGLPAAQLTSRLADPAGLLGADDEADLGAYLSMPLRVGDRLLGYLALSSPRTDGFGEAALGALAMVESPAALVVDNARLRRVPTRA